MTTWTIHDYGNLLGIYHDMATMFLNRGVVESRRQGVHAMTNLNEEWHPLEVNHARVQIERVSPHIGAWQKRVKPNLPWAEDHFQERVSGEPLNPAPSHEWWPFAQQGNNQHLQGGAFSHTYPERFWPRFANAENITPSGRQTFVPHLGVRFLYGDLQDLVEILRRNPWSRQAYLPVWFPEDLTAARELFRVPCTLGYHFLLTETGLDMEYHIRSCDFIRFFRDDVYMAGRLLQWVGGQVGYKPGQLIMNIGNFHVFQGDRPKLIEMSRDHQDEEQYGEVYGL